MQIAVATTAYLATHANAVSLLVAEAHLESATITNLRFSVCNVAYFDRNLVGIGMDVKHVQIWCLSAKINDVPHEFADYADLDSGRTKAEFLEAGYIAMQRAALAAVGA